jgi:hypothetical protein
MRFDIERTPIEERELDDIEDAIDALPVNGWIDVIIGDDWIHVARTSDGAVVRFSWDSQGLSVPTNCPTLTRARNRVAREIVKLIGVA